jgi:hypothetical protein
MPPSRVINGCGLWPHTQCRGADLRHANLAGRNLAGADFSGARLARADLRGANLAGANFDGADLTAARLNKAAAPTATFRGARLVGADLEFARLFRADFSQADLRGANLEAAKLNYAWFRGARLVDANLQEAKMFSVNLRDADLTGATAASLCSRKRTLRAAPAARPTGEADMRHLLRFLVPRADCAAPGRPGGRRRPRRAGRQPAAPRRRLAGRQPYRHQPAAAEAVAIGRDAYNQACARCHGVDASTNAAPAPDLRKLDRGCRRIAEPALKARCQADNDAYFARTVRQGKVILGVTHMPPWQGVLSQELAWAIQVFIESRAAGR